MGLTEGDGTHEEGLVGCMQGVEWGGSISTLRACGRGSGMYAWAACMGQGMEQVESILIRLAAVWVN